MNKLADAILGLVVGVWVGWSFYCGITVLCKILLGY